MIKVDAAFVATQLKYRAPDGQPEPAFVSGFVERLSDATKPWHTEKVTKFLNRLMEKQKIS